MFPTRTKPVLVRQYRRRRYGTWEQVRSHTRGLPRR